MPIPIGPSGFGLAIAGAVIYDPGHQTGNGFIVNVPVSFDFSKSLRVNVNFGAQYNDGDPRGLFATGGVGVSWNFVPRWSVISEVFAIMGSGQSNPRFQSGIRYSPTKNIDWDLIYGRNLTGEGANWITLALTVRVARLTAKLRWAKYCLRLYTPYFRSYFSISTAQGDPRILPEVAQGRNAKCCAVRFTAALGGERIPTATWSR